MILLFSSFGETPFGGSDLRVKEYDFDVLLPSLVDSVG